MGDKRHDDRAAPGLIQAASVRTTLRAGNILPIFCDRSIRLLAMPSYSVAKLAELVLSVAPYRQ